MANFIIKIQGTEEIKQGVHYDVDLSVAPIGEGGMGRVYKGVEINDNTGVRREVAVKFLREDLPQSMIERARREASIRIRHDNLVEMIAFVPVAQKDNNGHVIQRLHVVSELLTGVMLYDLLQGKTADINGKSVPYAEELLKLYRTDPTRFAVTIGMKILLGIMQLHDAGYIHRDIDPSNIMITREGKIKLIDFGIARQIGNLHQEHKLTSVGNFLGKASYAAPELVLGDIEHQNATTDIYALGILLFQLVTGHLPFEGPVQDVLEMQRFNQMPLEEIKNRSLRKVLEKATNKTQSKRYKSGAQFRVALEEIKFEEEHAAQSDFNPYSSRQDDDIAGTSLLNEESHVSQPASIPQGTAVIEEESQHPIQNPETPEIPYNEDPVGTIPVETAPVDEPLTEEIPEDPVSETNTGDTDMSKFYILLSALGAAGIVLGIIIGYIF